MGVLWRWGGAEVRGNRRREVLESKGLVESLSLGDVSDQMPFWVGKSYEAEHPGFGFWLCHCLRDFVQVASDSMTSLSCVRGDKKLSTACD